ncbi:hypothetical protein HPB48_008545 [Haemaphysalis longicornis]|uniref:DNA-directed DNA polymerase n=1 Tax=Haemaphysalis longicornis TaxID=44386 RepID=A0A9J6FM76_HAELO|nr:hypothetical protein HPB48_008545 [Haemaphysalis longicornis]
MSKLCLYDEPELPARESFYNRLKNKNFFDDDYAHAQRVFSTCKRTVLGDHSDLSMKVDCLLLSDFMINFWQYAYDKDGLDPNHYVSLPSLGWECVLKVSRIKLELLFYTQNNHFYPYKFFLPYQKQLVELFAVPRNASGNEPFHAVLDMKKYICYNQNLKLPIYVAMRIKIFYKINAFSQTPFLRGFVEQNHTIRQQASNTFQEKVSKLLINSVYGKTLPDCLCFTELSL